MRKAPTSTADFGEQAKMLVAGGESNKTEIAKWGLTPAGLQKLLDAYEAANAKQEKMKSDLQLSTVNFNEAKKKLKAEMARWVSVLEGNYGKTGDKLQEFGVAPRMYRPKKGPRAKQG